MVLTAGEIAARVGGTVEGDAGAEIHALASLQEARAGDLSFLHSDRYARQLTTTRATAVLVATDFQGESSVPTLIRVTDPNGAFAQIAPLFAPEAPVRAPGVHPTAVIDPTAKIGRNVHIGPWTVIDAEAEIGDDCVIEAQVFIGRGAKIGAGGHVYPQVTVREGCVVGARCILHCGVRIGCDGYGFNPVVSPEGRIRIDKIPQLGIVELGDDVEIGANTTIDRARFGRTRIGNMTKLDNLVQIGHNVQVGDCSGIIAQAGVAGSARIGSGVIVWAQAGVSGHLTVHDRSQIGPQAGVTKDVASGDYVIGTPAVPKKEFAAQLLVPRTVFKMREELKALRAEIEELKKSR